MRNYGINLVYFNASFALLLSLYVLRYKFVHISVAKAFILLLPAVIMSFVFNGVIIGIYGLYEAINLVGSYGAAKYVVSKSTIDNSQIRAALRFIIIAYFLVAVIQLFAPAALEIKLDALLYPLEGGREWRMRYAIANGVRTTSNFGASTAAGGHLLLILIVSDLYNLKGRFISVLSILFTLTRHSIILMAVYFSRRFMSVKGLIVILTLIFLGYKLGVLDLLIERFNRGIMSDENIRSRLIYGVERYGFTMLGSLKNMLFGLGPGFLYSVGDPEWNSFGYVSNGFLLFTLQYGWLTIIVALVIFLSEVNFKQMKLLLLLVLLVMADNYSFHSSSFHFLIFLIYHKACRRKGVEIY